MISYLIAATLHMCRVLSYTLINLVLVGGLPF